MHEGQPVVTTKLALAAERLSEAVREINAAVGAALGNHTTPHLEQIQDLRRRAEDLYLEAWYGAQEPGPDEQLGAADWWGLLVILALGWVLAGGLIWGRPFALVLLVLGLLGAYTKGLLWLADRGGEWLSQRRGRTLD